MKNIFRGLKRTVQDGVDHLSGRREDKKARYKNIAEFEAAVFRSHSNANAAIEREADINNPDNQVYKLDQQIKALDTGLHKTGLFSFEIGQNTTPDAFQYIQRLLNLVIPGLAKDTKRTRMLLDLNWRRLTSDISPLVSLKPLHLLVALKKYHNANCDDEVLKLIRSPQIPYEGFAYGVNPAKEILSGTGPISKAMLFRILRDIKQSIENGNYSKALRLIEINPNLILNERNGAERRTLAFDVAASTNIKFIKSAQLLGCDFEVTDLSGQSPIQYAETRIRQRVKKIIDRSTEIEICGGDDLEDLAQSYIIKNPLVKVSGADSLVAIQMLIDKDKFRSFPKYDADSVRRELIEKRSRQILAGKTGLEYLKAFLKIEEDQMIFSQAEFDAASEVVAKKEVARFRRELSAGTEVISKPIDTFQLKSVGGEILFFYQRILDIISAKSSPMSIRTIFYKLLEGLNKTTITMKHKEYAAEIIQNGIHAWRGCEVDLEVMAKVFNCTVVLNTNVNGTKATIIYGSGDKVIQLVRVGGIYKGCDTNGNAIDNVDDDLNLFRSFLHSIASTTGKPNVLSAMVTDEMCVRLRENIANCVLRTPDLSPNIQPLIDDVLRANNQDELVVALQALPQLGYGFREEILRLKFKVDVVKYANKITLKPYLSLRAKKDPSWASLTLIAVAIKQLNELAVPISITPRTITSLEVKNLSIPDLKQVFHNQSTAALKKLADARKGLISKRDQLAEENEQQRKIAIAESNSRFAAITNEGMLEIQEQYESDRHRRNIIAFRSLGVIGATFLLQLTPVVTSLTKFFAASMGKAAAGVMVDASLATMISHTAHGGRLEHLPKHLAQNVGAAIGAHYATDAITGHNIKSLPSTRAGAVGVTVAQRTMQASITAAINRIDIVSEALTTAIASVVTYTAAGEAIFEDSRFNQMMLSTAQTGIQIKIKGGTSSDVIQGIFWQALESGANALAERLQDKSPQQIQEYVENDEPLTAAETAKHSSEKSVANAMRELKKASAAKAASKMAQTNETQTLGNTESIDAIPNHLSSAPVAGLVASRAALFGGSAKAKKGEPSLPISKKVGDTLANFNLGEVPVRLDNSNELFRQPPPAKGSNQTERREDLPMSLKPSTATKPPTIPTPPKVHSSQVPKSSAKIKNAGSDQLSFQKSISVKNDFIAHLQKELGVEFTPEQRSDINRQLRVSKNQKYDFNSNTVQNFYTISTLGGEIKIIGVSIKPATFAGTMDGWPGFSVRPIDELTTSAVGSMEKPFELFSAFTKTSSRLLGGITLMFTSPDLGDGTLRTTEGVQRMESMQPIFDTPPEGMDPPVFPNKFETPSHARDTQDGRHVTPMQRLPGFDRLEGKPLIGEVVDNAPLITPAERQTPTLFFKRPPRRFELDNGLIYEDAPYHSSKDNPVKSKAPSDPKVSLGLSKPLLSKYTKRRVSYDPNTDEICVFDNTKDNVYHGHVTRWDLLDQTIKNVLINDFGFKPNGKSPKI